MAGEISVSISQESVQRIIDTKVNMAIADALESDRERLIERVVHEALTMKSTHRDYEFARDKKPTVTTMIREEAKKVLERWAEENRDVVAAEIAKAIKTRKFAQSVGQAFADYLAKAPSYLVKVGVSFRDTGGDD